MDEPISALARILEAGLRGLLIGAFFALFAVPAVIARKVRDGKKVRAWMQESASRYREARLHGNSDNSFQKAVRLFHGDGVSRNLEEAAKLTLYAAEAGHTQAQMSVGHAYERGLGMPNNYMEAYIWYCVASTSKDSSAAESAKRVAESVSSSDMRVARRIVKELSRSLNKRASR